jgi:hypothetical protein
MPDFRAKLSSAGQKKLLALDGGGVRVFITVEVLAELEMLLQREAGDANLVLADYFDYIAGAGTGAMVASCLAVGMPVSAIKKLLINIAPSVFLRDSWQKRFLNRYEDSRLVESLKEALGANTTLGDERLRTLVLLVLRNASTNVAWPITNNPAAKYNDPTRRDSNLRLPLWSLVLASTPRPGFYPPQVIDVDEWSYLLTDGGATIYNNPGFLLFLNATTEVYNLTWQPGDDKLLLVSIGTGSSATLEMPVGPGELDPSTGMSALQSAWLAADTREQDFLCRIFGETLAGEVIDREIGDLRGKRSAVANKLFTYLRYEPDLSAGGLAEIGLDHPDRVRLYDSIDYLDELRQVGMALARRINAEHFSKFSHQ